MNKQNLKSSIPFLICSALLITAGLFALALRPKADPVNSFLLVLLVTAAAIILFSRMPLKRIIQGSMPLYLLVIATGLFALRWFSGIVPQMNAGGLELIAGTWIGLIWFGGAYCTSKYDTYRFDHLFWPLIVLLFVPVMFLAVVGTGLGFALALLPAVILYLIRLSSDGRVSAGLKGPAKFYFVLFVIGILASPVWVPWAMKGSGISSYRFDGPFAEEMKEVIQSVKIMGASSLVSYEMPAYTYYGLSGYAFLGFAAALRYGWLPLAAAVLTAGYLSYRIVKAADHSLNSYARCLALGTGFWFAMRIFVFCSMFYLRSPIMISLPFTGDVLTICSDSILASAAVCLCLRQDAAPAGLLDNKRTTNAMLEVLIDKLNDAVLEKAQKWDFLLEEEDAEYEEAAWDDEADIALLKQKIKELEEDKKRLEERTISQEEIIEKYAALMAETIVPQKYERDRIFLSHNHLDLPIVSYLAERLEEGGAKAWYYERDIPAGSYPEEIMRALKRTKIFVLIVSRTSNVSREVFNEVGNAAKMINDGLIIMPLVIDDVILSDFLQHYLVCEEQTFALERPLNDALDAFSQKVLAVLDQKSI